MLASVLLVLLALGAVATAQLYWASLRTGVAEMRASVSAAQREQARLLARVRAAEAALAERAAALAAAGGDLASASAPEAPETKTTADRPPPPSPRQVALRASLLPVERARLHARLEALGREAARLPPSAAAQPAAAPVNKQLLRDQLGVAAAAAAAGDVALLDAALFAAQRLAGTPHGPQDARRGALAAELAALRDGLQRPGAAAARAPMAVPRPAPAR
ncbi:hypothetical protein [uncultured Thiohalocapsa sp.]|uniref:hypothetical protein n=1 Tax=uncultured Thiohalocapsa sp. TaxID=768990 RepID=UPI0025CC13D1|nr:hypothetical protein [uncultured Thiohalocapsa sp.]